MKIIDIVITVTLVAILVVSVAAFNMPSLLGRPLIPGLAQPAGQQLTAQKLTADDLKAQAAEETFSLTISGNIYVDKLPVEGAEVTIYLNGRYMGKTTAGDLYQFQVPGVRMGDTIRVDAKYQGYTGSATEVVKFKSMYLDVNVKSGRSFIRNALEMLPKKSDLENQQQQTTTPASTPQSTTSTTSTSPLTSTSADANKLTSQVVGDTTKTLANTIGATNGAITQPAPVSTADTGSGMNINSLSDMMNFAGEQTPVIS